MNPTGGSGSNPFRKPPTAPISSAPPNASRPEPVPTANARLGTAQRNASLKSWIVMGGVMVGLLLVAVGIFLVVQVPRWRADAAAKRAAAETAAAQATAQAKFQEVLKDMYKDVWEFRRSDEPDEYSRYRMSCRAAVVSRLKSPGSAKFVSMLVTVKSGRPEVLGEVDSQNSYGALVRSNYGCPFSADGRVEWGEVLVFSTR